MSTHYIAIRMILAICLASSVIAPSEQETVVDQIIAQVGDQIILQSELEEALHQCQAQGVELGPDPERQVLRNLLAKKILLASAQAEGVSVEEEHIESTYKHVMQNLTSRQGEAMVAQQGPEYQEQIKKDIREQLMIHQMYKKITDDISVTPREVKAFFDTFPKERRPYYPAQVDIRQILCYPTPSQQDQAASIEQLQALKARLQAGEKFEDLAKQHSEDTATASRGGEVGFRRLEALPTTYQTAILALSPGETSDPVETPFGFHLIQLIEKRQNYYNTRHILVRPSASAPNLPETIERLASIRESILAGSTTFEDAAKQHSQDIATAAQGGLLTSAHGTTRMSVRALSNEIFFAAYALTPGTISEPTTVTIAPGKQAVRILYLKEKIPPHPANLQQDYEKIAQAALEHKKEKALEEWFQKAQAEVFTQVATPYQDCIPGP